MNTQARPVVVGVDGSAASWPAIHTAAWEAEQRGAPLLLAHGYPNDYPYTWYGYTPPFVTAVYEAEPPARAMVEETASRVRTAYPDLSITTLVEAGPGAHVLVNASRHASLVVVGARGHGGFAGLSIGSVAAQTATHAEAPVIVVRPPASEASEADDLTARPAGVPRPGPVIVGVDGSTDTDTAVEFAFQAADRRGVPVVATYVWWELPRHNLGPDVPGHYNLEEAKTEASRLLAELTAGWSAKYPDIPLRPRAVHSMNPSAALLEASQAAGLMVVGSRGRGGFTGLLLGSVGRDLVGHAACPVAVIHPPRR